MKKIIDFFKDEEGASMVEYGILVALIAAVCIVVIGSVGDEVNTAFTTVEGELIEANTP